MQNLVRHSTGVGTWVHLAPGEVWGVFQLLQINEDTNKHDSHKDIPKSGALLRFHDNPQGVWTCILLQFVFALREVWVSKSIATSATVDLHVERAHA